MKLFDAHNHLQDERLRPARSEIITTAQGQGVAKMVVNGSCEEDWAEVFELAGNYPGLVVPSFGLHPWYVSERTGTWQRKLAEFVNLLPAGVGEIGLDKWIIAKARIPNFPDLRPASIEEQEEVFVWQLRLASEKNLPVSIHCLQAWGNLLEILKREPAPKCGFVLHSFGGPKEMIHVLTELGAYFSLPGFYAHDRKERQRETFRHVPLDRLLIETDAPDQSLPESRVPFPLTDPSGKPINHPANLRAVYEFAAELTGSPLEELARRVEENFMRLFGSLF